MVIYQISIVEAPKKLSILTKDHKFLNQQYYKEKGVSFDPKQNVETNLNKSKLNQTAISNKKTDVSQNNSFSAK